MNTWKLHVEGLGKIKETDVEVGPFTMFVGDNNSGKSYLMTLIWGIRTNVLAQIYQNETNEEKLINITKLKSYSKSIEILKKLLSEVGNLKELILTEEELDCLMEFYSDLLDYYKDEFVKKLFQVESVSVEHISIEFISKQDVNKYHKLISKSIDLVADRTIHNKNMFKNDKTKEVFGYLLVLRILSNALFFENDIFLRNKEIYFPASRTGFVLTYKMLIDYVLRPSFKGEQAKTMNLTLPCLDFLQNINWISQEFENEVYNSITDYMERNIIAGKMELGNNVSTELFYTPKDDNVQLPMKLCSGVVTEVALVIMFLKYLGLSSITIEEPEMCLHPQLQWKYARAFVKMYHKGLPVCMATHSDIFMAHINNMIMLQNNPEKESLMKEYGYEEDDLIEAKDVKVYQFDVQDDGITCITEIKATEEGFQVPSFQKALKELLEQAADFETEES